MDIENPRLRARAIGGYWDLWIYYTATFHPAELNQEFKDTVNYWEHDPEWYDLISAANWDTFRPQSTRIDVEWELLQVPADLLDTEWGDEEVRGEVYLHSTVAGVTINKMTPIVTISP